MPDQPNQKPDFSSKPLEQPIMDSQLRSKLQNTANNEGGFKGFYQANKVYFWAIGVGALVIVVLAFLAFHKKPPSAVKEANVKVTIDAPQQAASGGEEIYKIKVDNQDSIKLVGMELELAYDNGITYVSSSPNASNLSGTVFPVPDLIPGQNAVVIVKAKVAGSINDNKKLVAKLHYKLSNFNSDFVKQQDFSVRLIASDVTLELTGPTQTNNAQLIVYNVKYQNNSKEGIKNARVQLTYPDGFKFASASPQPNLGSNVWDLGTLAQGASGTIEIQGTFASINPGESKTAKAEFLILGSDGQYFTQSESDFTTAIGSLPLLVTQSLSQNNPDNVVNPGDVLRVNVRYQNNSTVAARGVNIVVSLDSKALNLSSIAAQGGQINNNTITWNASSVSNLESLSPNESGTVSFTVNITNPATKDSSKNLTVVSHVKIQSNEYETAFPGNDLSLKISSPSQLASRLDYVSGQQPPQVGKSTLYRVTLTVTNSTNDFSDTAITAFIPLGAGGFENGSSNDNGNVTYDPSTGKLTWNAGSVPAHAGQFTQAKTLTFNVRLNPSTADAGKSPVLVKSIVMDAKDVFTGKKVHDETDDITTASLSGNDYQNTRVLP